MGATPLAKRGASQAPPRPLFGGGGLEDDRALLEGFRRGDREALAHVFRRYVNDVMAALRAGVTVDVEGRRTRIAERLPEHEVENLMQETFARAFTESARLAYDGVRPYGAYLCTIARNLLVDRARRRMREARRVVFVEDVDKAASASGEAPEVWGKLESEELDQVLAAFKDALDEADRQVFEARYEHQLGLRPAAKALGMGMFEVRRRDARLRVSLLEALRAAGFLEDVKVRIGKSVLARERGGQEEP